MAWRLGGDGAALLSDDGILLVVGTTLPRIAAIDVRPELRDPIPGGESREVDEMHGHGLGKPHVELLAAIDLRLHLLEGPSFLIAEQPGDQVKHLLDPHAA